jgi:hypothetical protein
LASTLSAHAAFFVERSQGPDIASLLEPGPLFAISGGIFAGLVAWVVAATCADPRRDRCLLRWMSELVSSTLVALTEFVPPIARIALGGALAWCAAIGAIATPNLQVGDPVGILLRAAAIALGVLLVLGIQTRAAASASIALLSVAALVAGTPLVVLERLDIVGLALFVAMVGGRRLEPRIDERTLATLGRASTWLRVLVASGLVVVAITEKLANVPMTARVLAEHPNVDIGLLLGTDPRTTVLLLGAAEIAFAVLVLLLPLPELVALAIGAPFVLSVGEFGLLEVPGHLPVWGAVAVLALLGSHPQTSDLLGVRPPWLRSRRRTPDAARERVVGARVPWAARPAAVVPGVAAVTTAPAPLAEPLRIMIGGAHTPSAAPEGATIPAAPPLAPQVAAWLAVPQPSAAAVEQPRFEWAPHAGAGHAAVAASGR